MKIDIFSDHVCPWCRIGKQNLLAALAQWNGTEEFEIHWRAFQLDPSIPEEGRPFQEAIVKKMGGQERMEQAFTQVCKVGETCGTEFDFAGIKQEPNTFLSHMLVKLVPQEKKTEVAEALFRAHFQEGRFIGDPDVLAEIAGEAGLDGEALRARLAKGEGREEVEADLEFAQRAGIRAVPFFILNDTYGLSGAQPVEAFLDAFGKL
jgi:predicted DsbA family dithiol-disulfide isomerase